MSHFICDARTQRHAPGFRKSHAKEGLPYLRCMIVIWTLAGLPFGLSMTHSVAAAGQEVADLVLIRHRQVTLTVEDVTGVPYQESLRRLTQLVERFGEPTEVDAGFIAPAMTRWRPDGPPRMIDWYHHTLAGAVQKHVHACVFDRFLEEHPTVLADAGILTRDIDQYVEALAAKHDAIYRAVHEWLDGDRPVAEVERELQMKFPAMRLTEARQSYIQQAKHQWLALHACFPRRTPDGPPKWLLWDVKSKLMRHLIESEIRANGDSYQALLQSQEEIRTYFVVRNATPEVEPALKRILENLMHVDGSIAGGGVDAANRMLERLGSPVRIAGVMNSSQHRLASEHGVDKRLDAGELFRLEGKNRALITFQEEGERPPPEENPHRGGRLYGFVSRHLQMPLIAECCSSLELPNFVRLPDDAEISENLGGTYLLEKIWGSPLPFLAETHVPMRMRQDDD